MAFARYIPWYAGWIGNERKIWNFLWCNPRCGCNGVVYAVRILTNNYACVVSVTIHLLYYPASACAKGLRNRFCPSVSQSVCLSGEKFWNQHIYWVKQFFFCFFLGYQLLYAAMTWQKFWNQHIYWVKQFLFFYFFFTFFIWVIWVKQLLYAVMTWQSKK